jgi:hypothetical protein
MINKVKEIARPEEIIEAIGDGISIQDANYIIVYQNEVFAAVRLCGVS